MIGSLLYGALWALVGFAWPACKCYKDVEAAASTAVLARWCRYWVVLAMFAVSERALDRVLFWLPLYSVCKLAYVYFLANLNGADIVFVFIRPVLLKRTALWKRTAPKQPRAFTHVGPYSWTPQPWSDSAMP